MKTLSKIALLVLASLGLQAQGVFPTTAAAVVRGTTLPATCSVGQIFFKTSATIGVYQCSATNTWESIGAGGVVETNLQREACLRPATDTAELSDAYVIVLDPVPTTNYDGICVIMNPDVVNTGAATLDAGLGPEPIRNNDDTELSDGTIKAGVDVILSFNTALDSGMGAWAIIGGGAIINNNTIQEITEIVQEVLITNLNVTSGSIRVNNQSPTGTEVNHLASLTGAPSTAIETTAGATAGVIGVVTSGAGTTGQARITIFGSATCDFTNATTAGDFVQVSTTVDGECQDVGSSPPTSGGIVIGRVLESGAAGNRTMMIDIQPAASTSSGGATSQGTFASKPATCAIGDLYFPTDSPYQLRCSATNTWSYFLDRLVTLPPSSGWTFDNQGASTVSTANGYLHLFFPRAGAVDGRMYYRTAPATPYTITALVRADLSGYGVTSATLLNTAAGMAFRDGDDGKIVTYYIGGISGTGAQTDMVTSKWTDVLTPSADYKVLTGGSHIGASAMTAMRDPGIWLRITDNGTNLLFYWSMNGRDDWIQFDTRARADFMTGGPTQYGFFVYINGSPVTMDVLSLVEE